MGIRRLARSKGSTVVDAHGRLPSMRGGAAADSTPRTSGQHTPACRQRMTDLAAARSPAVVVVRQGAGSARPEASEPTQTTTAAEDAAASSSSAAAAEQPPPPPGLDPVPAVGQMRPHESPTDETPLTKKTEMRLPMKVDVPAGMKRDMRSLITEDSFWEASPSAAADRTKRSKEMISMIIAVIIPCEEEEEKQ